MSVETTDTVEARVARGAAWLDENNPGWERRIDLAELDLKSSCRCVLGQIYGNFNEAPFSSRFVYTVADSLDDAYVYMGFDAFNDHTDYAALDEAWISLIKERFASGLLSDERGEGE